jgi:hypothetical protein
MKTPLSAKVLKQIITELGWDQSEIAMRVKLARPQISCHLSGARPIRDDHLSKYMRVLPQAESVRLLAAWMQDVFDAKILMALNNGKEWGEVARQKIIPGKGVDAALIWWGEQMLRDREMETMFLALSARLGFNQES